MASSPAQLKMIRLSSPACLIALLLSLVAIPPAPAGEQAQDRASNEAPKKAGEPQNPDLAPALEKWEAAKTLNDQAKYTASLPVYREALTLAPREKFPETWAKLQMELGMASSLAASDEAVNGNLDEGDRLLEETIAAYRSAQEIFTQQSNLTEWANSQRFIGYALAVRRKANSDFDGKSEGVAAIRELLRVLKPETHPKEWSTAQASLGHILSLKAESAKRKTAEIFLTEALIALDSALKYSSLEKIPEEWIRIQLTLGKVHLIRSLHGTSEEKQAHLAVAEQHYQKALETCKAKDSVMTTLAQLDLDRVKSRIRSLQKSNP